VEIQTAQTNDNVEGPRILNTNNTTLTAMRNLEFRTRLGLNRGLDLGLVAQIILNVQTGFWPVSALAK